MEKRFLSPVFILEAVSIIKLPMAIFLIISYFCMTMSGDPLGWLLVIIGFAMVFIAPAILLDIVIFILYIVFLCRKNAREMRVTLIIYTSAKVIEGLIIFGYFMRSLKLTLDIFDMYPAFFWLSVILIFSVGFLALDIITIVILSKRINSFKN